MQAKIYLSITLLGFLFMKPLTNDYANNKRITVTGIAEEVKIGAVVTTDKGYYVVDGLHDWDKKYYGKKVKVTGRLVIKTFDAKSEFPGQFQEITGKVAYLKNPKWSLAE